MPVPTGRQPTTAPYVKAQLAAVFTAALAGQTTNDGNGVQVFYGPPPRTQGQEFVLLGAIDYEETSWSELGTRHQRAEKYAIRALVHVVRAGQQSQDTTERVFELYAFLDEALTANPGLPGVLTQGLRAGGNSGAQILWIASNPNGLVEGLADQASRLSQLHVEFVVNARI